MQRVVLAAVAELLLDALAYFDQLRKRHAEVYERLDAIEHQITTNTTELERLARALAKEENELFYAIVKREAESYIVVIKELQAEKDKLTQVVREAVITDEDIKELDRFAKEVRSRLPQMTFAEKRRVIEALNLTGTLAQEENERVIYIHWHIHTWRFSLQTNSPSLWQMQRQTTPASATARGGRA